LTSESYRTGKQAQEKACAETFLKWFSIQRKCKYQLERAETNSKLKGRWDFVAWVEECPEWIAIEVKELVVPQSRRQFGSWSKFATLATKELLRQKTIQGSFTIITHVPWQFNQKQNKLLINAFMNTLNEIYLNINKNEILNIGPNIATRFNGWPCESPTINHKLFRKKHIFKIVNPPKELSIIKLSDTGYSVNLGACVGQPYEVELSLTRALLNIFNTSDDKNSKPNEQLKEAKQKGASETILLLDSHILWEPNIIAKVLKGTAQSLMSNIDAIYLVSVSNDKVKGIWPLPFQP